MNKILIVEDDQIVANIYHNKLCVEGYLAEIAGDAESGLNALRRFRPDAVILDLVLPGMNGVEFLKQMRADPDSAAVPVIVFTNTYLANLVQQAWKAGATKCLSKANCSPKQLIDVVRATLNSNGSGPATKARTDLASKDRKDHIEERIKAAASPSVAGARAHTAKHVQTEAHAPAESSVRPQRITASNDDAEFQADLRTSFLEGLPTLLTSLRALLQAMIKAENELVRLKHVHELYRRMHALTGNAALANMVQIAQMADALEALLKELYEKPEHITASSLRTVATAVDFIGLLFERSMLTGAQQIPSVNILVVDDESISRQAVVHALQKARLKNVAVEAPQLALSLLQENRFDLVILDVDMPGMNGFELCSRLRNLPGYQKTPVVFVTALSDFEARANSLVSGGNDLIAKPFLFIELTVKALVYVMRARLEEWKRET